MISTINAISVFSVLKMIENATRWIQYTPPPTSLGGGIKIITRFLICFTVRGVSLGHWYTIDSFTVSLHIPNGRHLPAVRDVQGDCQWALKNEGNSHWLRELTNASWHNQSQLIFRPINHKRAMPASCRPYVTYPNDSLPATRLGLCSSLDVSKLMKHSLLFTPRPYLTSKCGRDSKDSIDIFAA